MTRISVDDALQGAFYRGIYASTNLTSAVDVTCQTGNCTWSVFAFLGVCSTCHDVTAKSIVIDSGKSIKVPGGLTLDFEWFHELAISSDFDDPHEMANIITFAIGQIKDRAQDLKNHSNWRAFYCSLD